MSTKSVDTAPAQKSGSFSTARMKERLVTRPRTRNSAIARTARRRAVSKSGPRQVTFASSESKYGVTSAPT